MTRAWDRPRLLGYLGTWSSAPRYRAQVGCGGLNVHEVAGATWPHLASRRLTADWTINVQQERSDDPRIAPTRPRRCRKPAPPPATATGRASPGRLGGGGSGGRPTESPGLADRCPESPAEEDRRGGGGPVRRHERGSFPVPPTTGFPGRDPDNGSSRDSRASVRPEQVVVGLDEAQPSGKSHLPVVGVPGFHDSIFGPSRSAGVHDRRSLSLAGEVGARAFVRRLR